MINSVQTILESLNSVVRSWMVRSWQVFLGLQSVKAKRHFFRDTQTVKGDFLTDIQLSMILFWWLG